MRVASQLMNQSMLTIMSLNANDKVSETATARLSNHERMADALTQNLFPKNENAGFHTTSNHHENVIKAGFRTIGNNK